MNMLYHLFLYDFEFMFVFVLTCFCSYSFGMNSGQCKRSLIEHRVIGSINR